MLGGANAVSTFYLLPPRPLLGQQFAAFLEVCFPGLYFSAAARRDLAEQLGATAQQHGDVFVVFREDLPEGADLRQTLVTDFGASVGDDVVEVPIRGAARRWQLAWECEVQSARCEVSGAALARRDRATAG
jgi:hypothetical protein